MRIFIISISKSIENRSNIVDIIKSFLKISKLHANIVQNAFSFKINFKHNQSIHSSFLNDVNNQSKITKTRQKSKTIQRLFYSVQFVKTFNDTSNHLHYRCITISNSNDAYNTIYLLYRIK